MEGQEHDGVVLTHIGGPTLLIEVGGWRLLTDPTFDPAGGDYSFGVGIGSTKLTEPSVSASDIGPIDAVLLSHDQHEDNLDRAGRELLPGAGAVVTTRRAASGSAATPAASHPGRRRRSRARAGRRSRSPPPPAGTDRR